MAVSESGPWSSGIIKNALRKFKRMALRNEINVTDVDLYKMPVSLTTAGSYPKDRAYFILGGRLNF